MLIENDLILKAYDILFDRYGPQGWWPLRSRKEPDLANQEKFGFNKGGYHPGKDIALSAQEQFEIACGAILTQNTNWNNAAAAVDSLIKNNLLSAEAILSVKSEELSDIIKTSGYYNQKAKKLKFLSALLIEKDGCTLSREELLSVWGIGRETADSILLYSYGKPFFIIDLYTRRFLSRISENDNIMTSSYDDLRETIEGAYNFSVKQMQEYHALIVIHGKNHCAKKAICVDCPFAKECKYN
ncbi:MAG: DNA repair protein [Spirochaetales bacterium]|nr:DNA repair protein [Spirochaetales bacterium]